jgi:hypothetical protein
LLDHIRLKPTCDVETDVLDDLVIIDEMSILYLQMMSVVHEHALASDVLLFLCVPSEPDLDRAVLEIRPLNHYPLVNLPLVEAPLVTAEHEFGDEALLILDLLEFLKLNSMLQTK